MRETKTIKRSSLTRRMLVLSASIAIVQSIYLGSIGWLVGTTYSKLEKERRVKNVVGILSRLSNLTQTMTIGVLKVVSSREASKDPQNLIRSYNAIAVQYWKELALLKRALKPYPETHKDLEELVAGYQTGVDEIDKLRNNLGFDTKAHYFLLYKLQESSNITTEQLEKLEARFRNIREATNEELQEGYDWLFAMAFVVGGSAMVTIALLMYKLFLRDVAGRLKIVADNTVSLAMGKPLVDSIAGDDEIAQLDHALRDLGASLADSKSKERTILENAAEFICSMNSKGIFLEVNQASASLWGYSPDELIGRRISSLILPEETKSTLDAIDKLFNDRLSVTFENTVRRKDGTHIELVWTSQPGENDDSAVMIAHDMTERNRVYRLIRESEERFRTIIDSLPATVLTLNSSFQILAANPTTSKMFQFLPAEILGKDMSFLFTGVTGQRAAEDATMVKAAQTHSIELQALKKDKTPLAVSLNVNKYVSQNKDTFLAVLQDITTRREIELVKRDFISMISHDLRSPLTSLHGTLGMMSAQIQAIPLEEVDKHEKFILIDAEIKIGKLVNLINDFLDLEKIESGAFTFETKEVSLVKILGAASERLNDTCPDMDRSINYKSPDTIISVRVDQERMILAIVSFACAIIRFSQSDSPEVTVTSQKKGTEASIFISADNCTVPQETRNTCLKRYAIVDFGQHETWTVSGLSLALARATVEAHQGTLTIETRDGKDGFCLNLPCT